MMKNFPNAVKVAFATFDNSIFKPELRIVGGCVRDLLLDKTPKDWDMCTNALPGETSYILKQAGLRPYDLSNGHGTISFNYEDDVVEITTLRIDEKTDGRHAEVKFVDDFKLDAERRDFTFNAMSMDSDGNLYDYFGGKHDLKYGYTIFVGDADKRIQEDYLRILRFFRFFGRYAHDLQNSEDEETLEAIKRNAEGLKQISGERIWMEMQQIFAGPNADYILSLMEATGVTEALGIKVNYDLKDKFR